MKIAVIPARGGSKRIPRKNVRPFHGQPMISWPIAAALETGVFDHVVVSTDDPEIAEVAKSAGASAPFLRPPELADDFTGVIPVIKHAMTAMAEITGESPDLVCAIYATAPFLSASDIKRGHDALVAAPAQDYAISVTPFAFPVQRALRQVQSETGPGLAPMYPEFIRSRSQDLEEAFHDAAQFFWCRPKALLEEAPVFSPRSIPITIAPERVQDIDTEYDWRRAELMFQALRADDAGEAQR
ncbi:pseudaminic acid cytidylyltransferase [Oceanicaulis sp. LC35]|uniref:pseudaminic acid cytidylyltransferase n=1 Tax=Oceanicaulis sp. LC35 TaxID=3349635 RepID=UPI003F832CF2